MESAQDESPGVTLEELPKSNTFTCKLPADPAFETPKSSHHAPRETLGPRLVRGALFTYVRPESTDSSELLCVSDNAMKDIGLKEEEKKKQLFKDVVSGNHIFWTEDNGGIYPWAQCYGGFQFGVWAGQLGDGRAISLFETTNPVTRVRYEVQLKGAGRTPYSRFADGKAVLRSSIREFIISEALNGLGIPTTRALSLVRLPKKAARERMEPTAIVTRFAESWIRIGTFDLLRARGDESLIRRLATYVAEDVYGGWESLPSAPREDDFDNISRGVPMDVVEGEGELEQNRFARLYREIVRLNAKTVAAWQAYGFMNGVLNTDNTSIIGLSIDFGPFAFIDNFDPSYTPNHDDDLLRYSYKNQPTIIWWNLVRLGEAFAQLIGSGAQVDEEALESKVSDDMINRLKAILEQSGAEYKHIFFSEYKKLMLARLGLKRESPELVPELLSMLDALSLDFNHFFRNLSTLTLADIDTDDKRKAAAGIFFHKEGINNEQSAREQISSWLSEWRGKVLEEWGQDNDVERQKAMKSVNPKFLPRSWILNEVITRVEQENDRGILDRVLHMSMNPFFDEWNLNKDEEERFCGDVPKLMRAAMCSCSS